MKYVSKAVDVFLNTGTRFPRSIIWAMGVIKYSAARVNRDLGLLERDIAEAIIKASQEVIDGKHDSAVVVDVFQTGSGTGLNMNINEVIAARASEISGRSVHPNDHVNMGQSSNDVVPSAIRLAALREIKDRLLPALNTFIEGLEALARKTEGVVKPGRTHLRDALPVTMGQEFGAYLDAFKRDLGLLEDAAKYVRELPLGGTAVGTGLNTHPEYPERVIGVIRELTGIDVEPAESRFRAMRLLTDLVSLSGVFRAIALDLYRLCQDIRLMFSGPFTAIGEIDIPQEVAGSSIMPGKTNPVTVEASMLAASQVVGLDQANAMANTLGEFELSMGIPLVGYNIVTQITLLSEALGRMRTYVLDRISPDEKRALELAEKSPALITVISPIIGYDKASQVARKVASGTPIRQALREIGFSDEEIDRILDLRKLTRTGIPAKNIW